MGTQRFTAKLALVWAMLRSQQVTIVFQTHSGEEAQSTGFGSGDLKDMVLHATELKKTYNGFVDAINHIAAEVGDLHALQGLRDAIDALEKE